MHFQPRDAQKEARTAELLMFFVIPQPVANVLAEKAFDTFTKLLYAIDFTLIHLPFHVRPGREGRDLPIDSIVPGDVGNQVLKYRESFYRLDRNRFVQRQGVESRFAGQSRPAVDFRRAGATLAGFAVPAHRKIGSSVRLNVMQRIEHDHARGDWHLVFD